MSEFLSYLQIISYCISIGTGLILVIRPLRERIFGIRREKEGERCLLRSEMLRIYYAYLDKKEIKQYEFENFIKLYDAYKAMGGNSFIDEINLEIREWMVVR